MAGWAAALSPGILQALLAEAARCQRSGRLAEAEQICRQVLASNPHHPDGLHYLGLIVDQTGRHAEAIELITQAIAFRADVAAYHNNLGNALAAVGRTQEAIAHYRHALALNPDAAQTYNNLGNVLVTAGRPEEAIAHFERALALDATYFEVHNNLGLALQGLGRIEAAKAQYAQALALRPDYPQAHNNLGNALAAEGLYAEALASYRRAVALKPDYAQAHHNIGMVLRDLGELSQAEEAYRQAIAFAPAKARYYRSLADVRTVAHDDAHLVAMQAMAEHVESLPAEEQIELHFALGKAYGDLNEHERAFRHLLLGNTLRRRGTEYDEAGVLGFLTRMQSVFTTDLLQSKAGAGDASALPVFIVGMPRSGTTLVEQILAAHPQVFAAGERDDVIRAADRLVSEDGASVGFPESVPALADATLRQVGAAYVAAVAGPAPAAVRVTDKMPANFAYIGLIRLALPNARIIHIRRDPIDTCLSCFATMFAVGQPQSWDLAELGRYYRGYAALMQHWRAVLPPHVMLEVDYEAVVADTEGQARRIVEYCGLPWDAACLQFHTVRRPVRTASATQVRQPIYRTSVGRSRAYGELLRPLIDALDGG